MQKSENDTDGVWQGMIIGRQFAGHWPIVAIFSNA